MLSQLRRVRHLPCLLGVIWKPIQRVLISDRTPEKLYHPQQLRYPV
jgi:hypothetical protein